MVDGAGFQDFARDVEYPDIPGIDEFSLDNDLAVVMGKRGHPDIPGMDPGEVFYQVSQHLSSFGLTFREEIIMRV
jgi:hypothetical protein